MNPGKSPLFRRTGRSRHISLQRNSRKHVTLSSSGLGPGKGMLLLGGVEAKYFCTIRGLEYLGAKDPELMNAEMTTSVEGEKTLASSLRQRYRAPNERKVKSFAPMCGVGHLQCYKAEACYH